MNTCTNCGAANTPEAFSCGNCGAALRGHALTGEVTDAKQMGRLAPIGAGAEKKSSFDFSIIGVNLIKYGIVVVILAAAAWYFFMYSTPERTVKKFVAAGQKGDLAAMVSCLTLQSQPLIPTAEAAQFATTQAQKDSKIEVKLETLTVTGDTATASVTVTVKTEGAEPKSAPPQNYMFRKEGGQWKIDLHAMAVAQIRQITQANPSAAAAMRPFLLKAMGGNATAVNAWAAVFKEATGY